MAITVEAIYENGVLKPAQALPSKSTKKSNSQWSRS